MRSTSRTFRDRGAACARRALLLAAVAAALLDTATGQERPTLRATPPLDDAIGRIERDLIDLRRPNLHPSRVHFRADASQATVRVCVDVTNLGNADSTPTDVSLAVVVSDPRTLGGVSSQTLRLPLGVVSPGARPTELCGGYTVPNRTEDWDLHANAHVDPDDKVADSNEGDNQRWRDCRLYSESPSTYRTHVDPC